MFVYPKDQYRDRTAKGAVWLQWIGSVTAVGHFFVHGNSRSALFIVGLSVFLFGMLLEVISRSHILFWVKVKNHPDLAYAWFQKHEAWRVVEGKLPPDYRNRFPKQEWVGPFRLCVPCLNGNVITVFGHAKTYRRSLGDFLGLVQSEEN